jgi:hypothetical protein
VEGVSYSGASTKPLTSGPLSEPRPTMSSYAGPS